MLVYRMKLHLAKDSAGLDRVMGPTGPSLRTSKSIRDLALFALRGSEVVVLLQ